MTQIQAEWNLQRLRRSIFLKLLLVFALAAAANVGITNAFFHHFVYNDARRMHRMQNYAEYSQLLASEIGIPPSPAQLKELGDKLHLLIRYESPSLTLTSAPDVPDFDPVEARMSLRYEQAGTKVGRFHDYLAMETQHGPGRFLFLMETADATEGRPHLILGLVSVLLLVLFFTYLSIRRILRPLKEIEEGVREVARGNLDFVVPAPPEPRGDELGRLARSFNAMTAHVRSMVRSKERLLLDVSHEFRSPLTRIKVALELPSEEARGSVQRSVRELDTMISELLESARLDDPQGKLRMERIDLQLLLEEVVSRYAKDAPGAVLMPANGDFVCAVDPSRIAIAVQNLLENGMKYSALQPRPVEVSISRAPGAAIRIQVKDFGIGIPPGDQGLIFEPFYRVNGSREKATGGYGLGLSLTKKIIEAHRGRIAVASVVGKETVFTVEIPG